MAGLVHGYSDVGWKSAGKQNVVGGAMRRCGSRLWKMVPNGHLERAGDTPVARITGYTRQEERRRG